MHLAPLIRDLGVITLVAALVTLLFQRIRQPVVLGYIVAGLIVGPHTPPFPLVTDIPNITILAELGVIFLMFTLGLEFSFRKLARVGASAGFTAVLEVLFMLGLGIITGKALGWKPMDCVFLGAILSISSTTIIIKALDELGLKNKRFAEIIFGILIVEDLVAILLLVALTTAVSTGSFSALVVVNSATKLGLVVGSWFLAGYFVVPRLVRYAAKYRSNEMMTILAIALCLGLVIVAGYFHYSVALGAFIMGSILAESAESKRIEELMEPLRDLFAAIFFVSVGMLMDPVSIWNNLGAVAVISLVTIVGKILSTSLGALATGQTFKNSIMVGFSLAQIGEFSFIIATLGLSLGVMSEVLYPIAVAVSLVTTFTTPFLIKIAPRASESIEKMLPTTVREFLTRYVIWQERLGAQRKRGRLRLLIQGFLSSFKLENEGDHRAKAYQKFVPWDGHLVRIQVHPNSELAGVKLIDAALRKRFGLNIVAIQRGTQAIVAPMPNQIIFPRDELLVLGTDDQIDKARAIIDQPGDRARDEVSTLGYELRRFYVSPDDRLNGRSIRQSELRERFNAMVVGLEREGSRIMNPDTDIVIQSGDTLWIVGESKQLAQLAVTSSKAN